MNTRRKFTQTELDEAVRDAEARTRQKLVQTLTGGDDDESKAEPLTIEAIRRMPVEEVISRRAEIDNFLANNDPADRGDAA